MQFIVDIIDKITPYQVFSVYNSFKLCYILLFVMHIIVISIAKWGIFKKAGQKPWKSLIPLYNNFIMFKIACKSGWWALLYLIPYGNILVQYFMCFKLSQKFGKGIVFSVATALIPHFTMPILAFGDATYIASNAKKTKSKKHEENKNNEQEAIKKEKDFRKQYYRKHKKK